MRDRQPPLRYVQLTPPGRGAVATLLVEGTGADRAAGTLLRFRTDRTFEEVPVERPFLARFGTEAGEDLIVRRCGTDRFELHCHGGFAAVGAIEQALAERGFQGVSWQEWLADDEDPIAAAARIALAEARTERTAAILLDQYRGALRNAFEEIERKIRLLVSDDLPSPSSSISFPKREEILAELNSLLRTLEDRIPLGRHLTNPWRVVLMGEPNVGKSCLLNALLGYRRAIVHSTPGTTRDLVTAVTAFEGWPVELCDTAGLRTPAGEIERAGIALAQEQIEQADLLLLVFDVARPWSESDRAFVEKYPQAVVVFNKIDLISETAETATGGLSRDDLLSKPMGRSFPKFSESVEVLGVSTVTGQGVDDLERLIARRLVPENLPSGAAVPFLEEHVERLRDFARQLER